MWELLEYCSPFFIAFTKIQALEILSEEFNIILQRMSPTCQGPEGPLMALWSLYVPVPSPGPGASSSPWAVSPCRCAPAAPFSPACYGHPKPAHPGRGTALPGVWSVPVPQECWLGLLPWMSLAALFLAGMWDEPWQLSPAQCHGHCVCSAAISRGAAALAGTMALSLQWGFLWSTCRPFPIGSLGQSMVPITSVPWVQSLRGPFSQ